MGLGEYGRRFGVVVLEKDWLAMDRIGNLIADIDRIGPKIKEMQR